MQAGSPLTLTYLVSNLSPDGSAISDVQVLDDAGTPADPSDDIVPLLISGDDGDQLLEVGELWLYAAPAGLQAKAGPQRHLASVIGSSAAGNPVTDDDLAHYNGNGITASAIRLEKAINPLDPMQPTVAEDADSAPGPTLLVGTPITWTYQVFNQGAEAIQLGTLVDDAGTPGVLGDDFTPAAVTVTVGGADFNVGDADRDQLLDLGEVWRFTSAGTSAGSYQAVIGAYANLARVSGTGASSGTLVQDDDAAHYLGVMTPPPPAVSVRLEKAVNAANPLAPTAYEDADFATGPILTVGSTVVWTYQVINTGISAFAVSTVRDDAGTPALSSDDFTPTAVLAAGSAFNMGDIDRDNLVDANEVWLYRASGTVAAGQYVNNGVVTVQDPVGVATANASDLAHHYGSQAGLQVLKAVNAAKPLAPTVAEDANSPATPVVLAAGSTVVFSYAVRNTGSDALATVTLIDDNGTIGVMDDDFVPTPVTITAGGQVYNTGDSNKNGRLDRNETWLYSASRVVGEGAYTNVATASGTNTRTQTLVRDDDPAHLFGAVVGLDLEKAINAVDPLHPTAAEDADQPLFPVMLNLGTAISFTYLLANTGNGAVVVNAVRDDAGTPGVTSDDFSPAAVLSAGFNIGDLDHDNLLDVGEVWRFSSVGTSAGGVTAELGLHTNTATAIGTDGRTGRTATDVDTASYFGQAGAVRVEKAINAEHPSAPTRYEDADVATGPVLEVGSPTVWTYQVFNQSGIALDIVELIDSDGFSPVYVSGDTHPDGRLDPDEVWLFTSASVIDAPTAALPGQQANTVSLITVDDSGVRYTDDDLAHYLGTTTTATSGIRVVKAINAVDPSQPTVQEDANDALDPVILTIGTVPTYTFLVSNLGTNALNDIVLTDDAATDSPGDDFRPVPVQRGSNIAGDTDKDGLLDPGETWRYSSAGVYNTAPASGAHVNVAQVSGKDVITGTTVRDDDVAHFVVALPAHTLGRMTGGGSVFTDDGMRVTHGFELHCDVDIGPNNLEVNFDKNNFHLETVTAMACYDDPRLDPLPRPAPFDTLIGEGVGRFNNKAGYTIRFTLTDNGEPGKTDIAQFEIRDPQGRLVLFVSGKLHNGNHQAHPENKTAALLQAAAAPVAMVGAAPTLQASQLAAVVAQARHEWADAGAGAAQLAQLDAVQLRFADLPGLTLGQAEGGLITLDRDAAGWGWFVDRTPQDDREFARSAQGLVATAGPAVGRMDLLSVLTHELGHVLGLDHGDGVMGNSLQAGHRSTAVDTLHPSGWIEVPAASSSAPASAAAPAFSIDWSAESLRETTAPVAVARSKPLNWQDRFVSHLGATPQRLDPNASLRLHLDVAPRLLAKPGGVGR